MPKPTRRRFIDGTVALAGAACLNQSVKGKSKTNTRIARIESIPVSYPVVGRFKFLEGPDGKPLGRRTVVVKITADDGTVGWGQSVPSNTWSYETLESVHTTIERYLAPTLVGIDVFDRSAIQRMMDRIIAPSFSTGQPICKAGIDLALFDLTGRLLGRTASERWRQKGKEKVRLSWTLNPRALDDLPEMIEQGHQLGYGDFNVKIAPDPEFDLEMCRTLRKLAPDGFIWVDANGGYDEKTALEVAPKLADLGIPVLEQPLKPNRISGYQKLKKQGALPIILDESVVSSVDLEEFIKLEMLDGVAMKVARCGGLTEACRMMELIRKHNLLFLGSGLTDPDLSFAASLLFFGAYELPYPAALNGPQYLAPQSILKRPLEVTDGFASVPVGPGLGVEVDEELLSKHAEKGAG
jgi:L-alanine-DL-glutamate epimerase-like enolase superfamily enzyme